MSNALKLGLWIRKNHPKSLTHLKLQKLAFYCVGASLAFDCAEEVGTDISFEPWENGPVNVEVWKQYKDYGAYPIPPFTSSDVPPYSCATEKPLRDVLSIYGRLTAWNLRNQSLLEKPWQDAASKQQPIDQEELRSHFIQKFRNIVQCPEYLLHAANFTLDGIPLMTYPNLSALAESLQLAFICQSK